MVTQEQREKLKGRERFSPRKLEGIMQEPDKESYEFLTHFRQNPFVKCWLEDHKELAENVPNN